MKLAGKDFIYVVLQILLFFAFLLDMELFSFRNSSFLEFLSVLTGSIGLGLVIIAFFQLNKNLSPFPTPKKYARLLTGGIFKLIRHPIYTGILFIVFSIAVFQGSGYRLFISILLMILFHFKTLYEEKKLAEKFPEYETYKKNTGKFLPKIKTKS
ncbi:methyltransferase family protein [Gillisia limnaea]|uniref:Isoprenylcysteine carboxyl methyltransferase n=1 Tax=Gillisia limnaea (strain DSM 15749 / LMG 21470 / R-8282) TaxID=865937 RepID=H2BVE3_GILLR|nr:isoprenylcysteine carboxylmethyltransferase family protein [Gillisia limnaea]EHQ02851.1 isoprenylcysteine carboxyl methyltransferase [Gillisia limnaea DSM 15749]